MAFGIYIVVGLVGLLFFVISLPGISPKAK
jgi:hypothetical protein